MSNNLHDPMCFELAEHFLGDASPDLKSELAQHIQDTVEDWLMANAPEEME